MDGILEVSFFGATERFAKLYAADDDNKPVGAPVARRVLVDAEFDAVTEGDPVRGLEGFDVHPDEEIHETNQEPSIKAKRTRTRSRRKPVASRSRRAVFRPGASAAAAPPVPRAGAVARARRFRRTLRRRRATAARGGSRAKRRESISASDSESDSGDSADARAALARFAGDGSGAFADLYAGRSAGVSAGKGPSPGTAAPGAARSVRRASEQVRRVRHERSDSNEPEPIFAGGRDGNGRREPSRERRPRDG